MPAHPELRLLERDGRGVREDEVFMLIKGTVLVCAGEEEHELREEGIVYPAFWEAIEAMGGPRREPKAAVDVLDEAITVVRAMWSGQRSVRTRGAHYSLAGVHPGPAPSPDLGSGWARTGPACSP